MYEDLTRARCEWCGTLLTLTITRDNQDNQPMNGYRPITQESGHMATKTKEPTLADLQAQLDNARKELDAVQRRNPYAEHEAAIAQLENQINAARISELRKQLDAALAEQERRGQAIGTAFSDYEAAQKQYEYATGVLDLYRARYKEQTAACVTLRNELADLGAVDLPPVPGVG
jgi:DNA repair exonuclease SbcCD ATPase subunit